MRATRSNPRSLGHCGTFQHHFVAFNVKVLTTNTPAKAFRTIMLAGARENNRSDR